MSGTVIRLKPYYYIHVLDNNSNVTSVEIGPQTYTVSDHQTVVLGETLMTIIPPRQYCIITNPVARNKDDSIVTDRHGQVKLRHGDEEVRLAQEPFPLYPGEKLFGNVAPLQTVAPLAALKLQAIRDFIDEDGTKRIAGDEWLFEGPRTYFPRVEVRVAKIVRATLIKHNEALRLKALKEFTGRDGVPRRTGEEWLVRQHGAYLPDVDEEIVRTVPATILTDKVALHLQASQTFKDFYGNERKAGEEWLVTKSDSEAHIPDVFERVVGGVAITTLTTRQYCIVVDPVDPETGKPQLGIRELRRGQTSFFLNPGESLEAGIQNVHVLNADESLLLCAREKFNDGEADRNPGDRWMINGPSEYVPPVTVDIIELRRSFPLDDNEGVYVRDLKTGRVRSVCGQVYMLEPYEELWKKDLPSAVEDLLNTGADQSSGVNVGRVASQKRDKTRVVTYQIPHSAAVQIYDYKEKEARVVFGPDLIMLGPDEQFTVLSLSGNTPKVPKQLSVIALLLGPRFSTDVVVVETADHARLSLKLSYNWHFDVPRDNAQQELAASVFSVPDFIGDFCKAIASRVRGSVAQRSFDDFHKNSATLIRTAVFGKDEDGEIRNSLRFRANNLMITNIDIQSVEPVDSKTRDALQKSVQLAIEITTKSQEAAARHTAEILEQNARGVLERQKIADESQAEESRRKLLELTSKSMVVEATGQASAETNARAAAQRIEAEAAVASASKNAEAQRIRTTARLTLTKERQKQQRTQVEESNKLEILKAQRLSEIETDKFKKIVDSIGSDSLEKIASSGPVLQKQLLAGLGLKSFMITDGSTPINLFNNAGGVIGMQQK